MSETEGTQEVKGQTTEAKAVETSAPETQALDKEQEGLSLAGIKEQAASSDAMAIESSNPDEEEGNALPSFFMGDKPEICRVNVDILSSKKTGRVMTVARSGIGLNFNDFKYLAHTEAWFDFTMPGYEELSSYRQRCRVWSPESQQYLVDKIQMRNFFLVWHLKEWSLTDKEGKKVELTFDKDGSLSPAAMKVVYGTHPTIIDVVLTVFEKDVLLT